LIPYLGSEVQQLSCSRLATKKTDPLGVGEKILANSEGRARI